jgi:hypothetical protein
MVVFMVLVIVLIGVAYADFCLIGNTAHFGISFQKVAEADDKQDVGVQDVENVFPPAVFQATAVSEDQAVAASRTPAHADAKGKPACPQRNPPPAWLLLDLEPVLELRDKLASTGR